MNTQELLISILRGLGWIHLFVIFCTIIFGAISFKKFSVYSQYILLYFIISFLFEITLGILGAQKISNVFVLPIASFAEFILLTIFYYKHILEGKKVYISLALFLAIPAILFADIASLQSSYNLKQFQAYGTVIAYSMVLIYGFTYLVRSLSNTNVKLNREKFDINLVVFCYFTVRLLIFSSINFMLNEQVIITISFFLANAVATLLFDLSIAYLLWKHGNSRKTLRFGSA